MCLYVFICSTVSWCVVMVLCGDVVGRAVLQSRDCGFDTLHFCVTTQSCCSHMHAYVTKQYN